jgi:hypothetical protein
MVFRWRPRKALRSALSSILTLRYSKYGGSGERIHKVFEFGTKLVSASAVERKIRDICNKSDAKNSPEAVLSGQAAPALFVPDSLQYMNQQVGPPRHCPTFGTCHENRGGSDADSACAPARVRPPPGCGDQLGHGLSRIVVRPDFAGSLDCKVRLDGGGSVFRFERLPYRGTASPSLGARSSAKLFALFC